MDWSSILLIEQLILLALIQGLTEFLPISSSAHLIIAPEILAWEDQGPLIDVAAHLGSLGAVLLYFRKDTASLCRGSIDMLRFKNTPDRKLFLFLSVATIPLLIAGAIYEFSSAENILRSTEVIGWTSIIFGVALFAADKFCPRDFQIKTISWKHVILLGFAQAVATIPGVSRSGITITTARAFGYSRPDAARFSMLMAIPAILAVSVYSIFKLIGEGDPGKLQDALIIAILSFFSAYTAIFLFMRMLERMDMTPFVLYRLALGASLLWWVYF